MIRHLCQHIQTSRCRVFLETQELGVLGVYTSCDLQSSSVIPPFPGTWQRPLFVSRPNSACPPSLGTPSDLKSQSPMNRSTSLPWTLAQGTRVKAKLPSVAPDDGLRPHLELPHRGLLTETSLCSWCPPPRTWSPLSPHVFSQYSETSRNAPALSALSPRPHHEPWPRLRWP